MPPDKSVATFFTTHAALRAEKVLKKAGIPARLIPAPRALSADCTIALEFPASAQQQARSLLESRSVEASAFHQLRPEG